MSHYSKALWEEATACAASESTVINANAHQEHWNSLDLDATLACLGFALVLTRVTRSRQVHNPTELRASILRQKI
eukprot:3766033-Amphidinium_carterae.2